MQVILEFHNTTLTNSNLSDSSKHKKMLGALNLNVQPKISESPFAISDKAPKEKKIAELRFAANIAMHSPILAADHFGEIMKSNICSDKNCKNKLQGFSVARTKCSKLIKNVINNSQRLMLTNNF